MFPVAANLIAFIWLIFIVFWIISAFTAKRNLKRGGWWLIPRLIFAAVVIIIFKSATLRPHFFSVSSNPAVAYTGAVLTFLGIALAIWARVYIGKNWGMPMSLKENPELVTSGPYHYVRHPIYSGVLLAVIGSALIISTWWICLILFGAYFIYSATQEEKIMTTQFPEAYAKYKRESKMLIPFIF